MSDFLREAGEAPQAQAPPAEQEEVLAPQERPMEPVEAQAPEVQEVPTSPPAEPDDSASYWQMKADKAARELEQLQSQLKEVEPYIPIAKYVRETPEILSQVEDHVRAPEQKQDLIIPEPPVRPVGFNYYDAQDDPESASAQYLAAQEQYTARLGQYVRQQQIQQQEFQQQAQLKQQLSAELKNEHKVQDVDEFLEFTQKISSDMGLLVDAFNASKGYKRPTTPAPDPKVLEPKIVPTLMGASGGEAPHRGSASQQVSDMMRSEFGKPRRAS